MNKNMFSNYLFYMLSLLIMLSSNNWFGFWMGMEMNTLSFVLFLNKQNEQNSLETSINYFLIQSMTGLLLFMYIMSHSILLSHMTLLSSSTLMLIMMMKMGLAPFHHWFLKVAMNSKMKIFWLLLTIQKLPYFFSIYFLFSLNALFFFFSMLNMVMSSISNLKQQTVKMILIFSSISQMSWILMGEINQPLWQLMMTIYSITLITAIFILENTKKQSKLYYLSIIIFIMFSGLPPFIMFVPKMMILKEVLMKTLMMMLFVMIMMSLVDLYVYTRYSLMLIMKKISENKWKSQYESMSLLLILMNLSLILFF